MNGQFQIAMHILTLLDKAQGELLSSDYMAASMNINPALARKEISNLRNCGLVNSREGKNGGYSLGKAAKDIRLSDVYRAVKHQPVLGLAKNTPNPDCPVGKQISSHLTDMDIEMDDTITKKLDTITLAHFSNKFN
jgi:Rrf2 family protein